MATVINHGEPGSYKTSSAVWFELLNALKEGRLVITNVEGMKSLETIQTALNLKFPETAKLWRISTQNEIGLYLMRNFFSWAPIGALILIDEIQGVYPSTKADKGFKIESLVRKPINEFVHLPQEFKDEFFKRLDLIKPTELEDGDTDDLGITVFDENGHIIYPVDFSDAFNRHRKYNWDIYCCTPDISEVHPIVRGVAEVAHSYKSNDAIGRLIPKYKRRPRIFPHKANSTGLTISKSDFTFFRKVPVDVHKLYKSTATGAHNDQSKGKTPLSDPKILGSFGVVLLVIIYYIWYFITHVFVDEVPEVPLGEVPQAVSVDAPKADSTTVNPVPAAQANKNDSSYAASVGLPYSATMIYLSGVQAVYSENRFLMYRQYFFELVVGTKTYSVDGEQLAALGYEFEYKSDCLVYLRNSNASIPAICPPQESFKYDVEIKTSQPSISIL